MRKEYYEPRQYQFIYYRAYANSPECTWYVMLLNNDKTSSTLRVRVPLIVDFDKLDRVSELTLIKNAQIPIYEI